MNHDSSRYLPDSAPRLWTTLAGAGALVLAAGLFLAPQRAGMNLLLVNQFLLGIALAGACFLAFEAVTSASWSVPLRPVLRSLIAMLPAAALLLLVVLLVGPAVYPWMASSAAVHDPAEAFKHTWLSRPFFSVRTVIYLGLWMALGTAIVRASRHRNSSRVARLSAIFLVVFGLTFWLASFDWLMSLEPHWYSTVFGLYNFSGLFTSGLAAILVFTVWLERRGALHPAVGPKQLQDLGTLLFAFSTFWAYIWFCQYMLIWYANFPEETGHYVQRIHGPWGSLFLLNLVLNWLVPFFALMTRASKREPRILILVACAVLAGRWLDLYLMIFPAQVGTRPVLGVWELGGAALLIGGLSLLFLRSVRQDFAAGAAHT